MKKKILGLILTMVLSCMPVIADAAGDNIEMTTAKITKLETEKTYVFDVEAANTYENCYVYAAVYGEDNALLTVNRVTLQMMGSTAISVEKLENSMLAKVFIWSGEMQPVIKTEEIPLKSSPTAMPTISPTASPTVTPTASPTPTIDPIVASGICGSSAVWSLDTDGTLTISGTLNVSGIGNMKDYKSSEEIPWYDNRVDIKNAVINDGITNISAYAFSNCRSLTGITIPDSVTRIGKYAFMNCGNLKDIEIPVGVRSIDNGVFASCTALTNIIIPKGVTSIGDSAFTSCIRLTNITVPNGVTSIGAYAFSGCRGLTGITIPDSVTSIGRDVFRDCSGLKSVYYAGSEEQWNGISISEYNDDLKNMEIVFNYTAE